MIIIEQSLAVLLPVYYKDNLEYFKATVKSLQEQTKKDFLILILVDGPLPEETKDFIDTFSGDKQFKVLNFISNRGLAFVLNDGIRYCLENDYKFIARMDADDICTPTRFESQLKFLIENPGVDIVGGYISEFSDESQERKLITFPLIHEDCFSFFKFRDPFAHPSVTFRNTYFQKAGLYDENTIGYKNWEDSLLWCSGFKNGCVFANIPEVVLNFRVGSNFFSVRRNGLIRAIAYTRDRYRINRTLKLGILAQLFLIPKFLLNILPSSVKKNAYNKFRK